ncbi:MAG: hypothetical protein H0T97_11300 [Actinobacteria bacterium]|nr:hypothetical protein [Actinomycetota bacterium]
MLLSAAVRFAVARTFDVPWIAPDEMIYGLVGQSLWESGTLTVRDAAVPYYSLLTPALVGLPLTLGDVARGVAIAQALQALAMSLVAVPVYLWGARLVGTRWALAAAVLAILPPALWYGGLLMTEALFYPLVVAALLALARTLEQPTLERQGLFLLLVSVAAAVRLQALLLLPVLLVAVGLDAWFGRSARIVQRVAPLLVLVGLSTAGLLVLYASGRSDLLGAYGELAQTTPASTGVLAQLSWHSGAVVVMTMGLPLLATATLAILAAAHGEQNPSVRAFLAVTTAYVVLLVGQVSAFAVDYLDHVSERYVVTALPPLLLGLCLWIARGGPRPLAVVLPLTFAATAALVALPRSRVGSVFGAHDALTLLALGELADQGDLVFRGGLLALGLALAAAFVLLPRRMLAASAMVVALGFVAASVHATREIDRLSGLERAHDFGAGDRRWVDRADVAPVLHLDTGEQPSTSVARVTFWNHSIRRLLRLEGVPAQALPQKAVSISTGGALVDPSGREVSAPYAVLPATIALDGERLGSSPPTDIAPGSGLWRVDEPLRLVSRTEGFSPIGDFGRAKIVVYPCGPGALELDLLGKDGLPIRVIVNGFPWQTVELESGGMWTGAVPSLRPAGQLIPCLFELESEGLVGSTRVEWAPQAPG